MHKFQDRLIYGLPQRLKSKSLSFDCEFLRNSFLRLITSLNCYFLDFKKKKNITLALGDKIVGEILASQSQDPNIRTDIISALPSRDISDDNFNNIMALNIEEIVLTNLEAVTNSRLRVDPHEARQLEDVKIPRYLDDGNVEDWAKTLSCGFCKTNLSLGDQGM